MSLKAKVFAYIEKLGTANGHAAPKSQDPMVGKLHEYAVSTMGEAYFKARRDRAKVAMLGDVGPDVASRIDKMIKDTTKTGEGEIVALTETEFYSLQASSKKGASFVDTEILRVEMLKTMPRDVVDKLWAKAQQRRAPSISYIVVEKTNG